MACNIGHCLLPVAINICCDKMTMLFVGNNLEDFGIFSCKAIGCSELNGPFFVGAWKMVTVRWTVESPAMFEREART